LRLAHDGAADGDALALPARQLLGLALQQRLDAQDLRRAWPTFSWISALGMRAVSSPKARFW
jgi:hypothetical protein